MLHYRKVKQMKFSVDSAENFIRHIIRDRLHWLPVPRRIQFKVCLLKAVGLHGLGRRYLRDELNSVAAVHRPVAAVF